MSTPHHDWDDDERRMLAGLEAQVDALQRRHRAAPAPRALGAAAGEALPEDEQARASAHLAESAWSRQLAADLEATLPESPLDETTAARMLARVRLAGTTPRSAWTGRGWLGGLALAASLLVAVLAGRPEVERAVAPAADTPAPAPAPPALAFAKPAVKLSPAALTWRGTSSSGHAFLDDLAPALAAYRADHYAEADRALTGLVDVYPDAIEVRYFQAASRMLRDDFAGAEAPLAAAAALNDPTFGADVHWLQAVTWHRLGRHAEARALLDTLCTTVSSVSADACAARTTLDGAAVVP